MKHRLKLLLRDLYARLLYHTGAWRLVDRAMPRRLVILFGHCVEADEVNGGLPADMKIRAESLARIVRFLERRFELRTIADGFRAVRSGGGRSVVALSMDDGYRDNATHLLPLLQDLGVPATIFLETRPLDERRVNWSHKYFWLLDRGDVASVLGAYLERTRDEAAAAGLRAALQSGGDGVAYRAKRVLKYDADPEDRERVLDELFREAGGDERALCDRIYMTWDDARRLRDAGIELGCHTVSHAILSRLDEEAAMAEIDGAARSMERELGTRGETFAYPFGRRWDYGDAARRAAEKSGYAIAVNTHAGANGPSAPRHELARIAIDDASRLDLLVAEACGGFDLLRRLGLNLSE